MDRHDLTANAMKLRMDDMEDRIRKLEDAQPKAHRVTVSPQFVGGVRAVARVHSAQASVTCASPQVRAEATVLRP